MFNKRQFYFDSVENNHIVNDKKCQDMGRETIVLFNQEELNFVINILNKTLDVIHLGMRMKCQNGQIIRDD